MGIKFSESTIKSSFLVETPDWYDYECTKVLEKTNDKGSINYIFIFEGRSGDMKGVGVSKLINEKADWVLAPLFKAAFGELDPEAEYDPQKLEGVTLQAYTKRGARMDGTPMNDLVDWRPIGG